MPTRVIAGRDDRFFPLEFQQEVARERLGTGVDEVPGGHLAALSRPAELTDQLTRYLGTVGNGAVTAARSADQERVLIPLRGQSLRVTAYPEPDLRGPVGI